MRSDDLAALLSENLNRRGGLPETAVADVLTDRWGRLLAREGMPDSKADSVAFDMAKDALDAFRWIDAERRT